MSLKDVPIGLRFAAATGLIALTAFAVFGIPELRARNALTRATGQMRNGLAALAAETLEPHRARLISVKGGCDTLFAAYEGAQQWSRLEWAAQACIEATQGKVPVPVVAMAQAWNRTGRGADALRMLNQAGSSQFAKDPSIPYAMYRMLREGEKHDDALAALTEAAARAPQEAQFKLDGLQYLAQLKRWKEALPIAEGLKDLKTENPEIKLFIGRVFANAGKPAEANAMAEQAKALLGPIREKNAQGVAALERAYADVLGGGSAKAPGPRVPAASK